MIDDLERLAQRGPHRDPSEVIDDALRAGTVLRSRMRRTRQMVVGVSTAVLLVGAAVVLAQRAPDNQRADGTPAASATTTIPVRMSSMCPTVEFSWASQSSDIVITNPVGRSSSHGSEQIEVAQNVFLERGRFDDATTVGESAEWVDVTVAGYETRVSPSATGTTGPHVSFVYPPDASRDDPCNVWRLHAAAPMAIEPLALVATSLQMRRLDTGEFAWVPLTQMALTDAVTLTVHQNCVAIDSALAKGSMCGTPLSPGINVVGTVDHQWAFGLAPPGTTKVTTTDAAETRLTETRLLDIGGYQAFAVRLDPFVTNVVARAQNGSTLRNFPVETTNDESHSP